MSLTHLLIVAVILLLFFGPTKLPQLGSALGKGLRDFKKGIAGLDDIDVTDSAKRLEDEKEKPKV